MVWLGSISYWSTLGFVLRLERAVLINQYDNNAVAMLSKQASLKALQTGVASTLPLKPGKLLYHFISDGGTMGFMEGLCLFLVFEEGLQNAGLQLIFLLFVESQLGCSERCLRLSISLPYQSLIGS